MSTKDDRYRELRAMADEQDVERRIITELDEGELNALREEYTENVMKIHKHEEHIKAYKEETIKPLKKRNEEILTEVRTKQRDEVLIVQGIINEEKGTMEYFDFEGVIRDSRNLSREERANLFKPNLNTIPVE